MPLCAQHGSSLQTITTLFDKAFGHLFRSNHSGKSSQKLRTEEVRCEGE